MSVLDRFRLDGKRLFITGGSRGFGRVIALAAAEAGADIVLNARDPDALARTAHEVRERGRQVWTFPADIAQPAACEAVCQRVLAEAGPIDIVVNNVGGRNLDIAVEVPTSRPGSASSISISPIASSARRSSAARCPRAARDASSTSPRSAASSPIAERMRNDPTVAVRDYRPQDTRLSPR
jgi:NAD(P)-dependent dehydrogenase (short-subunit alcohol dehydrogenase family)